MANPDPNNNNNIIIVVVVNESELLLGMILEIKIKQSYPTATILLAADGQGAFQLFERSRANLIISVEKRGELPDFQLTRTLRLRDSNVPIITISPDPGVAAAAAEAGSTLFLSGPNLIAELEEELGLLLSL